MRQQHGNKKIYAFRQEYRADFDNLTSTKPGTRLHGSDQAVHNGQRTRKFLPDQQRFQDIVRHLWDEEAKEEAKSDRASGNVGPLSVADTLPAITQARLATVHASCANARYGDAGAHDRLHEPALKDLIDVEDTLVKMASHGRQSKRTKASHLEVVKNRKAFIKSRETDWYESPRIVRMIRRLERHLGAREVDQDKIQKIPHDIRKRLSAVTGKGLQGRKAIVFSEFLSALDVAYVALSMMGYSTIRFDGWMSEDEKDVAKSAFMNDSTVDVLLMINRSGGVGLNLPAASLLMHLTPCWNPALTTQCNGRAIRPGQLDNIEVVTFYCKESIEQRIEVLATRKSTKAHEILDPGPDTSKLIAEMAFGDKKMFLSLMSSAKKVAAKLANAQAKREKTRMQKKSKTEGGNSPVVTDHESEGEQGDGQRFSDDDSEDGDNEPEGGQEDS